MRTLNLVLVSLALGASIAAAQRTPTSPGLRDAGQQVSEAQAAGVANAARPGDENLSCEALQAEIVSLSQGLGAQPRLQGAAQQAQADLAQVQEAQQAAEEPTARSRPRFGQMMRGIAGGIAPGADRASATAQQAEAIAQAEQGQAQSIQNQQRAAGFAGDAAAMAGPAMRGEHLLELGRTRNCAWARDGGAAPSAVPPSVPAPRR